MDDYPNPDEEFELMYGDELELLRDHDEENYEPTTKSIPSSANLTQPTNPVIQSQTAVNNSPSLFSTQTQNLSKDLNITAPGNIDDFSTLSSIPTELGDQTQDSSTRKRTVTDLFGDIGDLDEDFDPRPTKKNKSTKDDQLREQMEHIILLRKLSKEKNNVLSISKSFSTSAVDRDKHNISLEIPKYSFIGIRNHNGDRIYIRFHSEEYEKEKIKSTVMKFSEKDILGESTENIWEEAQVLLAKQKSTQLEENNTDSNMFDQSEQNKQLWTDLYRPKKYLELLSDEGTNRIMLKWLKLWDKVVFNRRPKIKPFKPSEQSKFKFGKQYELNTDLDEDGRPKHRVALLCGPPGLGKTTLAHVAAKHAGYNVVEINASDDRSTQSFKTLLENATQMQSVVDREGRPNCLVFDEIDGAPQSSIEFLIKFINGAAVTKSKKGKTRKESILKRPIICICNDVYVPALRPLRQIAFVINFPRTSSGRLAERLMCISRREQIKTDLGAMMALADKTNNDIRSCLSVLHFFKIQKKVITLSDIYNFNIGQKDMQKGLFAVWQDIFQVVRPKNTSSIQQTDTSHNQTMRARMSNVLQTISSFGDYDRVAQGVYENFPKLKLKDPSLHALSKAMDWFVYSDVLNKQIYSLQNYTLASYLPYSFVVWHFLFASPQYQSLSYPSIGYEMKQKETRRTAIVSEVLRGMKPSVRPYCNRLSLLLDTLPLLDVIIAPSFRPVSLHLYTKEEKEKMLGVVNVMIDYNLNYVQERQPDGNYVFNLEPNIDEVVSLCKEGPSKKRVLSYSNRQLVAREIDMEKMRRFEQPKTNGISKSAEKSKKNELPNHMQTLKARKVKTDKPSVAKDFFGRIISKPSSSVKEGPELNNDIWYQYKEGYNNAVRKTITLSDIL